ncbi:PC4/YdbC family ssDNA-binding protein [[Clostridium] symbiosum]|uniref:YdbC family protein n=1 Tax=Clostridium symbiosum TaxID=1512 RepID=UPI00192174D2|nr:PC4/YdbC family ssDNA-binding protein [[Clostridium] symbiosum]MDB2033470.1 PC4/YdbC family ssDNA-binding protein [[Clostridium] symbiosum]
MPKEVSYNIVETLIVLPATGTWHKELNLVSWNDKPAKYDLRNWNEDGSQMGKGITLTKEELATLKERLGGIEL